MNKTRWISRAKELGITDLEIYELLSVKRSISLYEGKVDSFTTSRILGTSLRAIVDGKQAEMALEQADDLKMDEILGSLLEQAKAVSTEELALLSGPEETERAVSKKHFVRPSVEKIKETLRLVEQKILQADPRIFQVGGVSWEEEKEVRMITNSLGLSVTEESEYQVLSAEAAARGKEEIKTDFKVEVVEDLGAFDADAFSDKLAERLLGKLGGRSLPTGNYRIILEKDAMTSLFMVMSGMFSGDAINKGISPIRDRLHEKIFSEKISVIDNPKNTDTLSVANYDDEGCPTREKALVKDGVFETALHSMKSALAAGTKSTGNGFKRGYASPVEVCPHNCMIVPGEKSLEELQKEMGEGLVITSLAGLHAGVNPVTTDFSLQCSGYYVKDGEKSFGVSLITVAGNYLELMNEVVSVGSDLEWSYRQVACPSILFSGAQISGE